MFSYFSDVDFIKSNKAFFKASLLLIFYFDINLRLTSTDVNLYALSAISG